ncbi:MULTISPECIES: CGNR zinc finger domain-containing protein [unclassified Pseudomonas]|uniref:CGNR zinc finger domain-containing protein n=1 Tax=unclassified Pseudomonas TaxID=196821 RepID=UPI000A1E1D45|nr:MULTISPECIES: ABATE domain-containing protein [unclassified Pseudomonas]
MTTSPIELPTPLILADHPALDLLNTQMMVDGQRRDLLTSDADAAQWLQQIGFGPADEMVVGNGKLLVQLRELRACIEDLLAARRENRVADTAALNGFLLLAVPQLVWKEAGAPLLDRFHQANATNQRLGRLAYIAAELLAEGDFNLVRKCESPDCSLMFFDRTKSHKRRWCSMALCGNRHKVAEFRKRRQGAAP